MAYLTQLDIEDLTPQEYSRFLSYGDINNVDDDEWSAVYSRHVLTDYKKQP